MLHQNASTVTDIYAHPLTSNRLDSITQGPGGTRSFVYDAAGKAIHVIYDLDGNRLAEYEIDNATGAQTLLQEYIWFDGAPVAVVDRQTDEVFLIRTDQSGGLSLPLIRTVRRCGRRHICPLVA